MSDELTAVRISDLDELEREIDRLKAELHAARVAEPDSAAYREAVASYQALVEGNDRLKAENARLRNHLRACKAMAEDQLRMRQRAGEAGDFGLIGRLHGIINECAALKGSDK